MSADVAKAHLLGLCDELIAHDELLKARDLLERCVRHDLESDEDVLARRADIEIKCGHTRSPEAEMQHAMATETDGLTPECFSADYIAPRTAWLLEKIIETAPGTVLDFGCGHGQCIVQVAYALALRGDRRIPRMLHGCSFASPAIQAGQDFVTQYRVPVELRACRQPLMADAPVGPYDLVAVLDVLEHTAFAEALLGQAALRSTKYVAVTVPGPGSIHAHLHQALSGPMSHVRQWSVDELLRLCEGFGKVVEFGLIADRQDVSRHIAVLFAKG